MHEKREIPKYDEWQVSFSVDSLVMKNSLNNANTVGKDTDINFKTEEKKLIITTGTDDKIQEVIKSSQIKEKDVDKTGDYK